MKKILRGLTVAAALLPLAMGVAPAAVAETIPALPAPTGRAPVGMTSLYLKDTSRPDPWAPGVNARELMVSLWYPARSADGARARYMTPAESELLLKDGKITTLPPDILSRTRTNAVTDAPAVGRRHSLPLIVLSPGFTKPRSTMTALAEDLASHGYVVAAIDHTYENVGQSFPDGRVTTCLACGNPRNDEFWRKVVRGRAADVSFVLDELTGPRPQWRNAGLIDPARIAMAGHSVGGASTIPAMLADSRIRAGIDIDGTTQDPIPDTTALSRPFLFLGKPVTYTPGSGRPEALSWENDWKHMTGWKRWLLVTGVVHQSFTDLVLLGDQLGVDFGAEQPGARTMDITRAYARAFFDEHLRGRPQPLLDRPSPRYPEVRFCSVEPAACT
ncbi:alpha/beta hydrolase family protein [Amycolatopsis sp. NPDC059027]|uniref:alpha/beta hydrolase family protein n=1 Tax=Amycolatopsis sp. NPDC059027 TaxID=3346709 RepID=UPI003670C27A